LKVCLKKNKTNILSATIASIVRTVVMVKAINVYRYDVTWIGYQVLIWLIVECNLAIICIWITVIRALMRKYVPCWSMSANRPKEIISVTSVGKCRRASIMVECSDVKILCSEKDKARRTLCIDEENRPELR
jgi:hypothetical protein